MLDLYTAVLGLLILLPLVGKFFFPYFWLDLKNLIRYIFMGYRCYTYMKHVPPITFLEIFLARVKKYSDKPLILFEDEVYSYRDIDRHSNQIARVLKDYVGLKEEDTTAVFFKNIPAYISVWIGLSKIGCTMACVNYNIRLKSLIHVLKSCKAKVLLSTPGERIMWLKFLNYEFLQYDVDADQPVRDEKGLCIRVPTGQAGLLVMKINKAVPFDGYAGDHGNTEKKILRNVLKKGDSYFNTGDLLREDQEGFIYFHDRVGDTFRWKGENVATTEVEMTLAVLDIIEEVNVYGVPVPGHEGKIGMAAIRLKDGCPFDGKKLFMHTKDYLPSYAIPHFIRIQEKLEITGTFKQCKAQLVRDGFNPATISDPLFFLDHLEKNYTPMTEEIYNSILEKKRKL
ncbi:long-chain fatty acid transport protein 2-like [Pituophis catenifer annectens]|uniref:long-chain fatty acid transport protein 2-like n=1 Tax=Pituophis catenifer annectens TaxID=94852 RepID=UPI0039915667